MWYAQRYGGEWPVLELADQEREEERWRSADARRELAEYLRDRELSDLSASLRATRSPA